MKKNLIRLLGAVCAVSLGAAVFTACASDEIPVHKHRFIDRERVEATCSTDGNVAHQECLYCGALYLDGKEVAKENVTLASFGKHILKTVTAGEATCYSKAHTQHYVCESCHQVVRGEEITEENRSSLDEVYSGKMLDHNFVNGVCANEGCGAKQVKSAVSLNVGSKAKELTSKAIATPGSWQALKGEADTAAVTAEESKITVKLASDSVVRLATVPAKDGAALVGVYALSFNLKVTEYNPADEAKTLRIGFSLRTGAGEGDGDIVNYPASTRQTAVNGVYNVSLLVEATDVNQLLQVELSNVGTASTDKTVELSDITYTYYPEAAKTFANRLEVTFPTNLPPAISYNISRINSNSEGISKVPAGQWRYYQASGSRNKGGTASGKGSYNGMTITFSGYFGKSDNERLFYHPDAPAGSKVTVTFSFSMTMDGVIAATVSNTSGESEQSTRYEMKANEPQTITLSYTFSGSNYVKLGLTINDVQNKAFPENGSCTFTVKDVVCDVDTSALIHRMETKVEAKSATCTEDGNLAYYHCTHCNKYFADELGEQDITDTYIQPKLGHDMKHYAAVAQSTCYQKSHAEYYHCERCNLLFSDEAGAHKLDNVEFGEKLAHNYVGGICTNAGCGAKKAENNVFEIKEDASGNSGNIIKETLIANPGTWAVQYNDTATKVNVDNNILKIEVPGNANQRAAFIRFIPAQEGVAFVGAYRISFDFTVTKSGTATSGTAKLQVGLSVQDKSGTKAGDTGSNGEQVVDFEVGKTYHFAAYIETLTAEDFFQFTARNIANDPLKGFELSNVVLEYESEAAKTGGYVVERIAFAEKAEAAAPAANNEALVYGNKSEYAE